MNWKRVSILVACLLLTVAFVGLTPQLQRSIGLGFGQLNDRVMIGTIAFITGLVVAWKEWRDRTSK